MCHSDSYQGENKTALNYKSLEDLKKDITISFKILNSKKKRHSKIFTKDGFRLELPFLYLYYGEYIGKYQERYPVTSLADCDFSRPDCYFHPLKHCTL